MEREEKIKKLISAKSIIVSLMDAKNCGIDLEINLKRTPFPGCILYSRIHLYDLLGRKEIAEIEKKYIEVIENKLKALCENDDV